jgi:hypothetical protein
VSVTRRVVLWLLIALMMLVVVVVRFAYEIKIGGLP